MLKLPERPLNLLALRHVLVLPLAAVGLLAGCVVAPAAPPPPPRAYEPPPQPPQPAYAEPAAEVEVQANQPPPPLPEYAQPPCPEEGYLWTPGYWAYTNGGYYWVPGTWVQPPRVGFLWTPGYWGFSAAGIYIFHGGYWGPHVGFYGGVNYGYGYHGDGFVGGRWEGNRFAYNTAVVNVNTTVVHNTYVNNVVVNNVTVNKVSYNGGAGGVAAAPTPEQRRAAQEPHVAPTSMQHQHVQEAVKNPSLSAAVNGGHPAIAATPRPAAFNAPGVVGARGAPPPHAPGAPNPAANPAYAAHGNATVGGTPPRATANAYPPHPAYPAAPQPGAASHVPTTGNTAHPQAATAPQAGHAPPPPRPPGTRAAGAAPGTRAAAQARQAAGRAQARERGKQVAEHQIAPRGFAAAGRAVFRPASSSNGPAAPRLAASAVTGHDHHAGDREQLTE